MAARDFHACLTCRSLTSTTRSLKLRVLACGAPSAREDVLQSANLIVCELAHAPSMMREAIDAAHLQAFIDGSASEAEQMTEEFLASLKPRPTFGLDDDIMLRRNRFDREAAASSSFRIIETADAVGIARRGELDAALRGSANVVVYCRIRMAFDFGLTFVRAVADAEKTWMSAPSNLDALDERAIAHSPLLTAAVLANRAGVALPADAKDRIGVERLCFDRTMLVDPIRPERADTPARVGALAFGVAR